MDLRRKSEELDQGVRSPINTVGWQEPAVKRWPLIIPAGGGGQRIHNNNSNDKNSNNNNIDSNGR